jgi:hypothetical protein
MNIETTDNSPLLQECIEELISSKIDEGKGRTAGNYRSAWNKLSTFLGPRVTEFTFVDLTTDFLHHYLLWLMQGEDGKQAPLKPGSLDFYIRNLKTMYNKIAQDKQMDVPRESPFSGLQIKVPPRKGLCQASTYKIWRLLSGPRTHTPVRPFTWLFSYFTLEVCASWMSLICDTAI